MIVQTWDPNDPLGLDDIEIATTKTTPAEPVPTGLSDEDDARRYLALRLNPSIFFCANCETHYEEADPDNEDEPCPYCAEEFLSPKGTPPLPTRFKR